MVQKVKASNASSGEKDYSRIVSDKGNDQGLWIKAKLLRSKAAECDDELAVLANLMTVRTLRGVLKYRDSCLIALQNKQTKLEKYMTFNDRTVDYDKLEHKLNETLGLLTQKEIDIKEGLKLKAYEISVVKEKHDELVKQSLLTKSHYEGLVKEKTKGVTLIFSAVRIFVFPAWPNFKKIQERCSMSSFQEQERQSLKGESSPSPLLISTCRNQQHLGRAFT
ncbi:hypothetical protein Tco_1532665 [Tanacetum coccineum]